MFSVLQSDSEVLVAYQDPSNQPQDFTVYTEFGDKSLSLTDEWSITATSEDAQKAVDHANTILDEQGSSFLYSVDQGVPVKENIFTSVEGKLL